MIDPPAVAALSDSFAPPPPPTAGASSRCYSPNSYCCSLGSMVASQLQQGHCSTEERRPTHERRQAPA